MNLARRIGRRGLHQLPNIGLDVRKGIPGLLSPRGLELAWFEYQTHLLSQINIHLEERPELKKCDDMMTLHQTCLNSSESGLSRLASLTGQAYNNEFFFRSLLKDGSINPDAKIGRTSRVLDDLKPDTSLDSISTPEEARVAGHAYDSIVRDQSFGSMSAFKESFIARGDAIFGNGAVWFVSTKEESGILNTYGWGTPLSRNDVDSSPASIISSPVNVSSVFPVLGINLWEHVYITDYGVAGKRRFLLNAFDCIDWRTADERIEDIRYTR